MMSIATVSFREAAYLLDRRPADVIELNDAVMTAFYRHFDGYRDGSAALSEYRAVQATVRDDECLTLFGFAEAMRANLDAHPRARSWAEFEREASASIQPYAFSMRFSGDDLPTQERNGHGQPQET